MTIFEMKKNELLEKGKKDGYLLISEISKECHVEKEEIISFQEELKANNIEMVESEPEKKVKPIVHEIKTFEDRKNDLIKKGHEKGKVTYEELAQALKGLDVDNDSLDELYNALVEANIEIVGEDDNKGGNAPIIDAEEPIILDDA